MRISLQLPVFKYPGGAPVIGPTLKTIAQTADAGGFYSLWVMDHFFQLGGWAGPDEDPMLEGYSTLSYLAGLTERVKLGTLVTGVIYRYPAVLVKTATTLDVLSGGRAYLGIGAAWYEHEAKSLGIPYPPTKERFELLEDALRLAHHMWQGDRSVFDGAHVHAEMPICNPQPLSQPHPPILIGGMGERKTLRFAAQYCDAINFFARTGAETLTQKLDVLREHCDAVGRDYDTIEKTVLDTVHLAPGHMSAADVITACEELAGLGFTHVIVNMPNVHEITPVETMVNEVIPAVAEF
ncbi:MAG: LLM class F420-dependent oxidoreductase [Anaerolineae bacterium]|nr:LLM class F420-dependent oxidoreductase [Anaerolineae bacterium]